MNRLKEKYLKEVKPKLKEEFGYKNELAVPSLKKVVVNMGIGEAKDNEGILDKSRVNLTAIAGQKPMVTKAKKSISAFKLTKGQPIGLMVTLRGDKMYSFLDKLINAVLPKVRDFRGVSDVSFDSQGNFNLGLREQTIFPEVDYRNVDKIRGLQVTIATTAPNKEQGKRMLELLGMPFVKE
ncbi:50S ribosomal protein L5 [Candidatus Daviesbacteria bacterium RIFCSPHIGHO2_01_FULL_38_8]|nr:MAG: 50S ribosomal protein L5 [Candidatus Daviesbacteria bacterium RIFCSPHIGHO2_01_FULL_38_8]